MRMRKEEKKAEGKYRIIQYEERYYAQKKNWLGKWKDLGIGYGYIDIEGAREEIKKDKGDFSIIEYY